MPRHQYTLLHADTRLNRRVSDALPTHRQCAHCIKILSLDVQNFYEDRSRFPWNLSRFRFTCKPCSIKATGENRAKRRPARNAAARRRDALLKLNRRNAAISYSQLQLAIQEQRVTAAADRKIRKAWFKRQVNRLRGRYVDPIKALIRTNQLVTIENRRTRQEDHEANGGPKGRDYLGKVDYFTALEAIRTQNRSAKA